MSWNLGAVFRGQSFSGLGGFELTANSNRGFTSYQGNMCNSLMAQGCDMRLGQSYRESPVPDRVANAGYGRDGGFVRGGGPSSVFNLGASGLFADQTGRLAVSAAYQNPGAAWGGTGINIGFAQNGGLSFSLRGLKL